VGLDIKAHCLPSQLSAGEQQRVAIARAIINDPLLLLADEPTGNIDPGSAEEIMKLFEEINFRGTTVVLATHTDGLSRTGSKERIILERGRIVESSLPNPPAGN
jgi:cell division transport system ATP-binding protein